MKKNGVFEITWSEYQSIKAQVSADPDVFIAEVDGAQIRDPSSFFENILFAFQAPEKYCKNNNFDSFIDWLGDLEWFKADKYNFTGIYNQYYLAILNQEQVRGGEPDRRTDYVGCLRGLVYQWTKERHYSLWGAPNRDFTVYLVHGHNVPFLPDQKLYTWLPPEHKEADFP